MICIENYIKIGKKSYHGKNNKEVDE